MERMKIFNTVEEEIFESPPIFNSAQRKQFFGTSLMLADTMSSLRTPTNKVCFLVAAGYFKARCKFFNREFRPMDIAYVTRLIGVNSDEVRAETYSKETFSRHQHLILNYFGFAPFAEAEKAFVTSEIATLVRVQFRPKLVLLEIIQTLTRRKIALPSYNVLAKLIVAALTHHQQTLAGIIDDCLTGDQRSTLDELLEKAPGAGTDPGWRYRLTLLKKPYQSTQPSKIRANLEDLQTLQGRYLALRPIVERLNLSGECIRYYAYLVIKAQIPQVARRADESRYLHLIAFVVYQTFRLNDTLIDTLLSAVQAALNAAQKEHKEVYYQEREQRSQSFAVLADRLGKDIRTMLTEIKGIVADPQWVRLNKRHKSPIGFHADPRGAGLLAESGPPNFRSPARPVFWGAAKPMESTIRSSEKSNSPCRLKCRHVDMDPLRMASISSARRVSSFWLSSSRDR
jgi:hypothetical protein